MESVGIFKTRPSVYDYAANALDVPNRSAFQSANGWDIVGAAAFGFTTIWINRAGLMEERPSASRAATLPSLPGLPALLGIASEK
jgi:2-haloacid dehalogenase